MTPAGNEDRTAQIAAGLEAVRARIDAASAAAGRTDEVQLVVVTKTFPASDVDILAALGVTEVAENRDQEARAKHGACAPAGVGLRWHMIGQLQRNKASSVARWADVVESVDRPEVVVALGRAAAVAGRVLDVLLQIALDPEPRSDRGGVSPADALALAALVVEQPGLNLRGVMGVAPFPGDTGEAFDRLRAVSDDLRTRWPDADRISAGMSGDLEQAVAHGATQVRIGGAVLGQRSYVQ
ncbi:MAG: YggS family pyridoxal phosphate-dependent enzyme [Actinobacteria bacterium]|nr:YggS family pyridoxal phosphate-dependent enzyme [Actinomycetota bacterium]